MTYLSASDESQEDDLDSIKTSKPENEGPTAILESTSVAYTETSDSILADVTMNEGGNADATQDPLTNSNNINLTWKFF
jgi:hypothetical protein